MYAPIYATFANSRPLIAHLSPTARTTNASNVATLGTNFIISANGRCKRMNPTTASHDSRSLLAPRLRSSGRKPGFAVMGPVICSITGFVLSNSVFRRIHESLAACKRSLVHVRDLFDHEFLAVGSVDPLVQAASKLPASLSRPKQR